MARIRTIKPEFWTSEQIMECSPLARLMFIGLWNFCDDRGVHPVAYKTLKAEVFPADDILSSDIERMVAELVSLDLLCVFEAEGRKWWYVTGWRHQLINRPSKSRYPEPPRCALQPLYLPVPRRRNHAKRLQRLRHPPLPDQQRPRGQALESLPDLPAQTFWRKIMNHAAQATHHDWRAGEARRAAAFAEIDTHLALIAIASRCEKGERE